MVHCSRVLVFWPIGLIALLLHPGCAGSSAPMLPPATVDTPDAPTPIITIDATTPTPDTPADPNDGEASRGLETLDLNGKWFGALNNFSPAEPPANDWNIDLDLTQNGTLLTGVVIISELIPIGHNIWDVYIRLDAQGEGIFDNGYGSLFLFNDVKAALPIDPPVVNGGPLPIREIDYAEGLIAPGPDDTLAGRLVIHWRLVEDHTTTWVTHCDLDEVTLVTGGGPG